MSKKQKDYTEFTVPFRDTFDEFRKYIDQQVVYNKLIFAKKIGEISSYLILLVLLAFLGTLILIFLSFGFVWWFSEGNADRMFIGFLIVAGFYALLAFFIFIARKGLIFKPIRKLLGNIVFSDSSSKIKNETFESSEMLDAKITFAKETLDNDGKHLADSINDLGEIYSFKNIGMQAFQTTYGTFVSAANIAKMSFKFAQSVKKWFTSRKRKKLKANKK